jgi:energy-coupling factor transporter ATP-binding protein EcfA2
MSDNKIVNLQDKIRKLKNECDLNKTGIGKRQIFGLWLRDNPKREQLEYILADAFLGGEAGREIVGEVWNSFAIATTPDGGRMVLKIKKGQECELKGADWLPSRIGYIINQLLEKGCINHKFTLTSARARAVADTVINNSRDVNLDEIVPFKFKSENDGFCWKKLDFDPEPGPTPIYDILMSSIDNDQQRDNLEAFCGALFDVSAQPQRLIVKYGDAGSGKSTFDRILAKIFKGTTGIVPSYKIDEQWVGSMIGKRIGLGSDSSNWNIVKNDTIKAITGNDQVVAKLLYMQPFAVQLNCLLIISSNEAPNVEDDATRRRLIPIHFSKKYIDEIPDIDSLLWNERAAIVSRWITAWDSCKTDSNGIIRADLKTLDKLSEDSSDAIVSLLHERFLFSPTFFVPVSVAWAALGIEVLSKHDNERRKITNTLLKLGVIKNQKKINGINKKVFVGMKPRTLPGGYE